MAVKMARASIHFEPLHLPCLNSYFSNLINDFLPHCVLNYDMIELSEFPMSEVK